MKYKGLTGKDIQIHPVKEQKKYVLRDAQLGMRFSKHNNGEVLDATRSISEITGLDFEKVSKSGNCSNKHDYKFGTFLIGDVIITTMTYNVMKNPSYNHYVILQNTIHS